MPTALQLGALRDALIDAGASPQKADQAAEEGATYETRFGSIDLKMEKLEGRLTLVQWQLGLLIGGVAALVIKAFT